MAQIELPGGHVALIDEADVDLAINGRWYAARGGTGDALYCKGRVRVNGKHGTSRTVYLHRYLLDAPRGMWVDHINYNTLDCRRANLRLVTPAQNAHSARHHHGRSPFKGVSWHAGTGSWRAEIRRGDERRSLGLFLNEREAALAYDAAAKEWYGDFARLNFPPPPSSREQDT